jgi:hypothetical protein
MFIPDRFLPVVSYIKPDVHRVSGITSNHDKRRRQEAPPAPPTPPAASAPPPPHALPALQAPAMPMPENYSVTTSGDSTATITQQTRIDTWTAAPLPLTNKRWYESDPTI